MYRVAREESAPTDCPAALVGFLMVPSVLSGAPAPPRRRLSSVFSDLLRSMWLVARRRSLVALLGVAFGAVGVAMLKAYTLVAVVVATAAFVYAHRAWRDATSIRVRPGVLACRSQSRRWTGRDWQRLPDLRADRVAESVANTQGVWQANHDAGEGGGSDVEVGSAEAKSPLQQLAFLPVAVVNAFFRPVLFEARGAPMVGAALENALLTLALLSMLRVSRRRRVLLALIRTPLLVFAVAFCAVLGVGVGLATSNLGSLSRYRMPMMSFYVATMLILRERVRGVAAARVVGGPRARVGTTRGVLRGPIGRANPRVL